MGKASDISDRYDTGAWKKVVLLLNVKEPGYIEHEVQLVSKVDIQLKKYPCKITKAKYCFFFSPISKYKKKVTYGRTEY